MEPLLRQILPIFKLQIVLPVFLLLMSGYKENWAAVDSTTEKSTQKGFFLDLTRTGLAREMELTSDKDNMSFGWAGVSSMQYVASAGYGIRYADGIRGAGAALYFQAGYTDVFFTDPVELSNGVVDLSEILADQNIYLDFRRNALLLGAGGDLNLSVYGVLCGFGFLYQRFGVNDVKDKNEILKRNITFSESKVQAKLGGIIGNRSSIHFEPYLLAQINFGSLHDDFLSDSLGITDSWSSPELRFGTEVWLNKRIGLKCEMGITDNMNIFPCFEPILIGLRTEFFK